MTSPATIIRTKDINAIRDLMATFPITAILGARQCGKTTLARSMNSDHFFDLENPRDAAKFKNPQLLLENLSGLIVIDEIQRLPSLFPLLRVLVDTRPQQKYLILGSASRDLVMRSSETLAGRIGFHHLGGFTLTDVGEQNWRTLWLQGRYPRSFLARSCKESILWRENYITTFLERDIPQLGIHIPGPTLRRFWMMLTHYHGQVVNYSEIGRSFGISDMTVRKYIDILAQTFMLRILHPFHVNSAKRLVKRPKIYLRDSGLAHTLMSIEDEGQLLAHPRLGASWEGFALEEVAGRLGKRDEELFFWSTHSGAEVDLIYHKGGKRYGVEFKFSDAPVQTKSMKSAMADLDLTNLTIIYPGQDSYPVGPDITVLPLSQFQS